MNQVFNYSKDIIVNYNYYAIVFQCYQILNVLFDLPGSYSNLFIFFNFINLPREDAYQKEDIPYNDIRYEEACILYNLGAMYSRLGANESRKTNDVLNIFDKKTNFLFDFSRVLKMLVNISDVQLLVMKKFEINIQPIHLI